MNKILYVFNSTYHIFYFVIFIVLFKTPLYAQKYVGAIRCKSCHEFEYQKWLSGPHAKSDKSLTQEQIKDTKCNVCHTLNMEKKKDTHISVQCESCHGAGQYYYPEYVMKDKELAHLIGLKKTQPTHCLSCHTQGSPSILPFDFNKMWSIINHSRSFKEAWLKNNKKMP